MQKTICGSTQTKEILDVLLSGATADIVLLFRNKPELVLAQEGIAVKIGMKTESIDSDLRKLTNLGLLKSRKIGAQRWFCLNKKIDEQIQLQIREYISSFGENKHHRCVQSHFPPLLTYEL